MYGNKVFAICLVALTLAPVCAGEDNQAWENEPFETFRLIDSKLTLLDTQFAELKKSFYSGEHAPGTIRSRPWVAPARQMRATTASIQRLGRRLRLHYRAHHQKAGYRLFTSLDREAQTMRHQLLALERSRGRKAAKRFGNRTEKAMLALVMQFQGIAAGYAAVHCEPLQWACGELKSQSRSVNDVSAAVKWVCVNTRHACGGLVGPQSPTHVPHVVQRAPGAK
jgi:hypothetical protein